MELLLATEFDFITASICSATTRKSMTVVVEKGSAIAIEVVVVATCGNEGYLIRRDGAAPKLHEASKKES